jgi:inhibitor of cysteine peptidase
MKPVAASLLMLLFAAGSAWAGGGRATVESIEILIAASFPVQISAVLSGYLSDGCTKISGVTARGPVANRFHIEITTERPPGALCTLALVPFEQNVPLDVYGLPKGGYEVLVGDISAAFTLRQDNKLQ